MLKGLQKLSNNSRGMTLVELLLVMAILSVVMMAVMSLYVPVHQSTVAQTQVSDVQSNLRLAINTMTRDLLTAGFLASRNPIVFANAQPNVDDENLTSIGTESATNFIVRTRSVGRGFARIQEGSSGASSYDLLLADSDMLSDFSVGSKVRIFGPMNGEELLKSAFPNSSDRVLTVSSYNASTLVVERPASAPSLVLGEAVVVRIKDDSQPSLQTIEYKLNSEGGLERIVNDTPQILARNLDSVTFAYNYTPQGRVNRVDIKLIGKTEAFKNDAISGEKTREVETSVRLRNVF